MNNGASFEDYVHYVYSTLLNLKGEKVQVSKRTTFKLSPSESYEVDIFYEFVRVGIRHRVAIECKDWKTAVDQGRVLEFHQKIKNIGEDIVGAMVSRTGFQSGAISVATRHGILTMTANEIPSIFDILARHITTSFIPESHCFGEPFWYIAELSDNPNEGTGTYYAFPKGSSVNIPLFVSKKHAEAYRQLLSDREHFGVFGMPQYKLRGLLAFALKEKLKFGIIYDYPLDAGALKLLPLNAAKLKEDYLLLDFPKELDI